VHGFCSKLRAPHRGSSLGPLVCGANKSPVRDSYLRGSQKSVKVCSFCVLESRPASVVFSRCTIISLKLGVVFKNTTIEVPFSYSENDREARSLAGRRVLTVPFLYEC